MRNIKVRIWDDKQKEWVHDTDHAVNILGETIIMGEILRRPDDTSVKISELNNLAVMQFTGFKDKNGKEIYEGDIIQHQNEEADTTPYEVPEITPDNWDELLSITDSEWEEGNNQYSNIEVIGNIYEHSHLLNQ
jgi:uncharacterized phage protein (TIGR01671 family)